MHGGMSSSRLQQPAPVLYARGRLCCISAMSNGKSGRQGINAQNLPAYSDRPMWLREPAAVAANAEGRNRLSHYIASRDKCYDHVVIFEEYRASHSHADCSLMQRFLGSLAIYLDICSVYEKSFRPNIASFEALFLLQNPQCGILVFGQGTSCSALALLLPHSRHQCCS